MIVVVDGTTTVGTPFTTPPLVMVATFVLLLVHAPAVGVPLLSVVFVPEHIALAPLMVGGVFTVRFVVRAQPVGSTYEITEVPPETPVAVKPPGEIVATVVVALLHVPPAGLLDNVVVSPTQTIVVPAILAGSGFTVNVACAGVQPAIV